MKLLAALGLVIFSVVLAGCSQTTAEQPDPNAPPTTESKESFYRRLFGQIQETASVASDANYANLAKRLPNNSTVAPEDLREILTSWKYAAQHRVRSEVRVEDGRIALTWESAMSVLEEYEAAMRILQQNLNSFGLKEVDAPTSPHLKIVRREMQRRFEPPQVCCYHRQSGEVLEEVVADVQGGLTGGKYESVVVVHWSASIPFAGPAPSLDQLAAALPQFKRRTIPRNDEPLLDIVRDQSLLQGAIEPPGLQKPSPYTGFDGVFSANLRDGYEAQLKKLGFEVRSTEQRDAIKQRMWHRSSDHTNANMITFGDTNRVRLSYTPPRRAPRATVELDSLKFDRPTDKQYFETAYRFGERTVEPNWTRLPLGSWSDTDFFARWISVGRKEQWMWASPKYDRKPVGREVHSLGLIGYRDRAQRLQVRSIAIQAKWCPAESGWSARFELNTRPKEAKLVGYIHFAQYAHGEESPAKIWSIDLGSEAYAVAKEFGGTRYRLRAVILCDNMLQSIISSPEAFRDRVVGNLDVLIEKFGKDVRSGAAVSSATLIQNEKDARLLPRGHVLVAIAPPAPRPRDVKPSDRKLTDEEKELLVQEAEAAIATRKQMVVENFREMHKALMRAFPLNELIPNLKSE